MIKCCKTKKVFEKTKKFKKFLTETTRRDKITELLLRQEQLLKNGANLDN